MYRNGVGDGIKLNNLNVRPVSAQPHCENYTSACSCLIGVIADSGVGILGPPFSAQALMPNARKMDPRRGNSHAKIPKKWPFWMANPHACDARKMTKLGDLSWVMPGK